MSGVYDDAYLPMGRWSRGTRLASEVGLGFRQSWRSGRSVRLRGSAGMDTNDRVFFRGSFMLRGERGLSGGWTGTLRAFAAGTLAHDPGGWEGESAPRERQFFLAGADPYQELDNPWLRSAGGLLEEHGVTQGGGGLPGYHPGLAFAQLNTLAAGLLTPALQVERWGQRIQFQARAFAGVGAGSPPSLEGAPDLLTRGLRGSLDWGHLYASAGAGVEMGLARSPLRLRVDVPFYVADPELAATGRDDAVAPRLVVSFGALR